MNILFFLTPKKEVAYVENDDTLRQVLEKIEYHKYTRLDEKMKGKHRITLCRYGYEFINRMA